MSLPESTNTNEPTVENNPPTESAPVATGTPPQTPTPTSPNSPASNATSHPPPPTPSTPAAGGTPPPNKILQLIMKKKKLAVIGGALLLLLFFLLLLAPKGEQKQAVPVETTKTVVAKIGEKPIYLDDIRAVALEKHKAEDVDTAILQEAFDTLIERNILDAEAKRLNISVTDKRQRYELLKEKIMEVSRESREVYSVGFDFPPYSQNRNRYTEDQLAFFEKQRLQVEKVLPDVEQRLRNGEIFFSLVQRVFDQYPDLRPIMKVNDYLMSSTQDQSRLSQPRIYFYSKENVGTPIFDTMFSLKQNEIKLIADQFTPGGRVIQIKKINNPQIYNYTDWLTAKKKELVQQLVEI